MPIYDMVVKNEFRQDLLYRINTVEVNLPPLRERQEDIPLLADHFLVIFSKKYKKDITGISAPDFLRPKKKSPVLFLKIITWKK